MHTELSLTVFSNGSNPPGCLCQFTQTHPLRFPQPPPPPLFTSSLEDSWVWNTFPLHSGHVTRDGNKMQMAFFPGVWALVGGHLTVLGCVWALTGPLSPLQSGGWWGWLLLGKQAGEWALAVKWDRSLFDHYPALASGEVLSGDWRRENMLTSNIYLIITSVKHKYYISTAPHLPFIINALLQELLCSHILLFSFYLCLFKIFFRLFWLFQLFSAAEMMFFCVSAEAVRDGIRLMTVKTLTDSEGRTDPHWRARHRYIHRHARKQDNTHTQNAHTHTHARAHLQRAAGLELFPPPECSGILGFLMKCVFCLTTQSQPTCPIDRYTHAEMSCVNKVFKTLKLTYMNKCPILGIRYLRYSTHQANHGFYCMISLVNVYIFTFVLL